MLQIGSTVATVSETIEFVPSAYFVFKNGVGLFDAATVSLPETLLERPSHSSPPSRSSQKRQMRSPTSFMGIIA